jgi:transcriptional regulator with XRE-family HTH domain
MNKYIIGCNIKKFRQFNGKKQHDFAKDLSISRIMLSRYENGHVAFTVDNLSFFAKKLHIGVEDLLKTN